MINADKKKEMKNLSEMLLETRGLTKRYGHHKAVDSVIMLKRALSMDLSDEMEPGRRLA